MIESIESVLEDGYVHITANASIVTSEEYRSLVKHYIAEIERSGLNKAIIDETKVKYAPSFLLQMDIVDFYSNEEISEKIRSWRVACIGPSESMLFFKFWEDLAQKAGYEQKACSSLGEAQNYLEDH